MRRLNTFAAFQSLLSHTSWSRKYSSNDPLMAPSKRQKATDDHEEDETMDAPHSEAESGDGSDLEGSIDSQDERSPDTDDEIAGSKWSKSKKTLKRKRRATDAIRFGTTLQSLLETDAPSTLPLSLKPSVARKRYDEKLESKGKKVLQIEKKEKEDKGRIKDVIGGWGGERERALRKVAQRGGKFSSSFYDLLWSLTRLYSSCEAFQCYSAFASCFCCCSRRS